MSAAVTLVLYVVPYGQVLARPLLLLSTLAHEMGHGLTALLLGGRFQRLEMWASGAGVSEM
ncbi:MAG TPA: M50 family metallopeptidase, partial [Thermoanaerobaculia bacterium]|nr:M50 family metallopeptidase [Thermoanaerobaculia bacterium]